MKRVITLAVLLFISIGSSHAALFDRTGGLIYDDVLDITWLADANFAKTSMYDPDGLMNWANANTWAANLNYGGYNNWRLPTSLNQDGSGPCLGYDCSDSEMGHMFYNNLGVSADNSITTSTDPNKNLFTNLQSPLYWSGTSMRPVPATRGASIPSSAARATAVRAVSAMPGPFVPAMSPRYRYRLRCGCLARG